MAKRVLFLDRDGIIVEEDQVDTFEDQISAGVFGACRRSRNRGVVPGHGQQQDGVGTPSFPRMSFMGLQQDPRHALRRGDRL